MKSATSGTELSVLGNAEASKPDKTENFVVFKENFYVSYILPRKIKQDHIRY